MGNLFSKSKKSDLVTSLQAAPNYQTQAQAQSEPYDMSDNPMLRRRMVFGAASVVGPRPAAGASGQIQESGNSSPSVEFKRGGPSKGRRRSLRGFESTQVGGRSDLFGGVERLHKPQKQKKSIPGSVEAIEPMDAIDPIEAITLDLPTRAFQTVEPSAPPAPSRSFETVEPSAPPAPFSPPVLSVNSVTSVSPRSPDPSLSPLKKTFISMGVSLGLLGIGTGLALLIAELGFCVPWRFGSHCPGIFTNSSVSISASALPSNLFSSTQTSSETATNTETATSTDSNSPTFSPTLTSTVSRTATETETGTVTGTVTGTETSTGTASVSMTSTVSFSDSISESPSVSETPSETPSMSVPPLAISGGETSFVVMKNTQYFLLSPDYADINVGGYLVLRNPGVLANASWEFDGGVASPTSFCAVPLGNFSTNALSGISVMKEVPLENMQSYLANTPIKTNLADIDCTGRNTYDLSLSLVNPENNQTISVSVPLSLKIKNSRLLKLQKKILPEISEPKMFFYIPSESYLRGFQEGLISTVLTQTAEYFARKYAPKNQWLAGQAGLAFNAFRHGISEHGLGVKAIAYALSRGIISMGVGALFSKDKQTQKILSNVIEGSLLNLSTLLTGGVFFGLGFIAIKYFTEHLSARYQILGGLASAVALPLYMAQSLSLIKLMEISLYAMGNITSSQCMSKCMNTVLNWKQLKTQDSCLQESGSSSQCFEV